MLYYAIVFLVVALIAAFLGFASLAGLAAEIAKLLFVVFLVLSSWRSFVEDLLAAKPSRRSGFPMPTTGIYSSHADHG